MKNLSLFNKIFYILNIAATAALLVSYIAPFISPETFWPLAFFSLASPILFITNILFFLYWTIQFKRQILLSFIAIAIGWTFLNRTITFNLPESATDTSDSVSVIKMMSYNVRVFDLYNWIENYSQKGKILDLLKDESPDITCFQEYFYRTDPKDPFITNNEVSKILDSKYYHVEITSVLRKVDHWGIATFSKYPIINKGKISFGENENNICIFSDIKINSDTIRVYNMHLASIGFAREDYKFVDKISNNESYELKESKGILKRLKKAFVKRAKQADEVALHIAECPYKLIVCGDFNDTPASYTYENISSGLTDAFLVSGNGFGQTYVGKFPSFRIDYILHSKELKSYEFIRHSEKYSDHHPVSCLFEFRKVAK